MNVVLFHVNNPKFSLDYKYVIYPTLLIKTGLSESCNKLCYSFMCLFEKPQVTILNVKESTLYLAYTEYNTTLHNK